MRQNKYHIGDQFIPLAKAKRVHTIIDILRTHNSAGEEVKMVYLAEHDFMGQKIVGEFVEASIARGIAQNGIPERETMPSHLQRAIEHGASGKCFEDGGEPNF